MAKLDWQAIEDRLVKAAGAQLATFAAAHTTETFYGAIFDVEPFDGVHVNILLNTHEHLLAEAGENAKELHYKWLPGGFLHTIDVDDHVPGWAKIDEAIVEATERDMDDDETDSEGLWKTSGKLVECVCRVALRLETTGAFSKLKQTPDFAIAVSPDPSEPGDMSLARMTKFRKKAAKGKPTAGSAGL